MEKPIYIREATWKFLVDNWYGINELKKSGYLLNSSESETITTSTLQQVREIPGPFLVLANIFRYPELASNTVVANDDGLEFVITSSAAKDIAEGRQKVIILRLYDQRQVQQDSLEVVRWAAENNVFDQLGTKPEIR